MSPAKQKLHDALRGRFYDVIRAEGYGEGFAQETLKEYFDDRMPGVLTDPEFVKMLEEYEEHRREFPRRIG